MYWFIAVCVLYCIVLYCIVLYCIVLYCVVLYCIVLYCVMLCCIGYVILLFNLCTHCTGTDETFSNDDFYFRLLDFCFILCKTLSAC